MTIFVAVTGASGIVYADRSIRSLHEHGVTVWATITPTAARIARDELQLDPPALGGTATPVTWYAFDDLSAPPASGATCPEAMLVVPCSMGTLGRIAAGVADTLIGRAADVCLKERKPLVLVTREMPLSLIHLRNMTAVTEAGATVLPACPYFYTRPATILELVDTVVARALLSLGVSAVEPPHWSPDAKS
ncbi:MAG: UbiX family flavin prenyltransferase [Candidatus Zipacnadales bacterium]